MDGVVRDASAARGQPQTTARLGPPGLPGPAGHRWRFRLLAYALAVILASANLPTPLYPRYQRIDHLSTAGLTLVFIAYVLAVAVALTLTGQLSDYYGRRAMLVPALALTAVGLAAFAASSGVPALLIGRICIGLATGAFTGVGAAALADAEPAGNTAHAALVASAATVFGLAAGPMVSGLLVEYGPWPTRLVYLVGVAALLPALPSVLAAPRAPAGRPPRRPRLAVPRVPAAARPAFLRAALAFTTGWVGTAMFFALGPTFAGQVLRTRDPAATAAVVFTVFVSSAGAQLLSRKLPVAGSVRLGLLVYLAGMLALPVALASHQAPVLVAGAVAAGAGQGLTHRAAQAAVTLAAPAAVRGQVVAAFYFLGYLAIAVLLVGLGLVIDASTPLVGLSGFVGVLAVAGAAAVALGSGPAAPAPAGPR